MFSIGFWEIFTIAIVVILFIKPEQLPVFFRNLGKFAQFLRHTKNNLFDIAEKYFKNKENK